MYICLIRAQTASIWWKNDQIWPKLQFPQVENDQPIQECLFSGNKSPCGSALVREELLETYPNQINSFKRDFKNWHFPKKWILEDILPVKINYLPKIEMVRMVHMNTFGRMDLENMDPKTEKIRKDIFWKMAMSKFLEKCIFGPDRTPAGCPTGRK